MVCTITENQKRRNKVEKAYRNFISSVFVDMFTNCFFRFCGNGVRQIIKNCPANRSGRDNI